MENSSIIQRKIKHIVMSGGSVWGFSAFGMISQAIIAGFLNMDDIKTIFCTSAGSIICTMLSLKIDHILLKEYLIQRPWETVCKKNKCSVLEIYTNKGIVNSSFIENMFSPLLKSVDLDSSATMIDLYNYNGIEIHIFVTELNKYELIDISYKTHPDWRIVDAIHSSCCIPIMFSPIVKDGCCYIDGGFLMNYPISKCLDHLYSDHLYSENCENEILGISLSNSKNESESNSDEELKQIIREDSNVFDLFTILIDRSLHNSNIFSNDKTKQIPYQIHKITQPITIDYGFTVLYNKEERQKLIESGIDTMTEYLVKWFS